MDYREKIAKTPILFKIRKVALAIFDELTRNANQHRCSSENRIIITDEDIIIADFTDCLSLAIESVKQKDQKKKNIFGWPHSFVCGFLEGNLHTRWHARYIVQHSSEYLQMLTILSITRFFEHNPNLTNSVHNLVQYFLLQDKNELMSCVDQQVFENRLKNITTNEKDRFREDMLKFLNSHSLERFGQLFAQKTKNYCPDIQEHLNQTEIDQLLEECGTLD